MKKLPWYWKLVLCALEKIYAMAYTREGYMRHAVREDGSWIESKEETKPLQPKEFHYGMEFD